MARCQLSISRCALCHNPTRGPDLPPCPWRSCLITGRTIAVTGAFMGLDHILMSIFVLVVGGLGSVGGLVTGSTLIGGVNSVVSALSDSTGGYFSVLAIAIFFLWLRPRGIHAR